MARKSRKHPELTVPVTKDTVGYIRLSFLNKESHGSVENQRLIIEEWGYQHQIPIMRYYIDNGFSGKRFDRPAFQEMLKDIKNGKIDCVIVKDFSRLGRDYITVGLYLEMFFPHENVRFVSINDHFDTTDGITNRDKSAYIQSKIRIPLINLFNE
jgi:site-specific DNA recombinase